MTRRPRAFGVAAVLVVAVAFGAYGTRAVLKVSEMRREMDTMERDLVTLRARTDELTRTVERLRNDPAYIEKLAHPGTRSSDPIDNRSGMPSHKAEADIRRTARARRSGNQ